MRLSGRTILFGLLLAAGELRGEGRGVAGGRREERGNVADELRGEGRSLAGDLREEGGSAISIQVNTMTATCGKANGSITVVASGGSTPYTYSMDGINYQASNVFPNIAGGLYLIWVKDNAGTVSNTSITLGNIAGPLVSATAQPTTCLNNDGSIKVSALGGTPPFQYAINNGGYQSAALFTGLPSGTSTISIKDLNGCLVSQPVSVPFSNDLHLAVTSTETVCEGRGVTLAASSNGTSFLWATAAGQSTGLSDATLLNPEASPTVSTTYYLTAYRGLCQLTSGPVTVAVNPAPTADVGSISPICYGKSVQLQGSGVSHAPGGLSYQWTPAEYLDNATIADPTVVMPATSITYSLRVTDAKGCSSLQDPGVTVTVSPPPKVFAGDDTSVVVNQQVPLHAIDVSNSGFNQYQWAPAEGLSNAAVADPVATMTTTIAITYTVTATTPDGCVGKDSVIISVFPFAEIFVPNAFTPNHDGHNDLLRPLPKGIRDFKYFSVYDRWGNLVFTTRNVAEGWNGTSNGRELETGSFIWMSAGVDISGRLIQRKGVVLLMR